ncbi:hypothetical protein PMAYCL1PPCAC_30036 [Pristionchus mayeri]|uniref:Skp1-related protein n=1 Tax=Pristionchus mayeri TaxID=1317129 RepID=A0AAN5DAF3_9BILA|nr:hypothetical protein PMAYCL1PPCAC_30036 [Pristionchus mayeri]
MAPLVKLVSSDGKEFAVDLKIARMSTTIAQLMEAMKMEEENESILENNSIPLEKVKEEQLQKVIEWCEYHKNDEKKEEKEEGKTKERSVHVVPEWDKQFLGKLEDAALCDLFMAANYLDVRELFNNCSQTFANILHGMKRDEIISRFNIHCDLSAEEISEIKKKNAWCEE